VQFASPVKGETIVLPGCARDFHGLRKHVRARIIAASIDEQATARQLGLSEIEMARTLRAAGCSGVVLHALIKLVCGEFIVFRTR
jgi:hypothetical protein